MGCMWAGDVSGGTHCNDTVCLTSFRVCYNNGLAWLASGLGWVVVVIVVCTGHNACDPFANADVSRNIKQTQTLHIARRLQD